MSSRSSVRKRSEGWAGARARRIASFRYHADLAWGLSRPISDWFAKELRRGSWTIRDPVRELESETRIWFSRFQDLARFRACWGCYLVQNSRY